ncbi:MAG: vWA domain-containing protein, partial [Candidatus Kapaibacterium sp.]
MLRSSSDRPGLSVLVDQSVSMVQRDARRDRRNDLRTALTISRWSELGEDVSVVGFDETVRTLSAAAMNGWTWNGQRTDIDRAMRYVQENAETDNTQAVLLFTDGAYTSGANPIVTAEQSGKPVYVIGIGDTTDAKDAAVTSIVTNDIGFVNATLPVQVTVRTHGYKASEVRLTLFDNSVAV